MLQAKRQILLAAYASREQAVHLTTRSPAERITIARAAVERLHPGHGIELVNPVAVHWQSIPYSEGPWVEWDDAGNDRHDADILNAGDGPFLFAGSHLSAYLGHWQEGAILSARRAAQLIAQAT
jgi:monoamine oxidase